MTVNVQQYVDRWVDKKAEDLYYRYFVGYKTLAPTTEFPLGLTIKSSADNEADLRRYVRAEAEQQAARNLLSLLNGPED